MSQRLNRAGFVSSHLSRRAALLGGVAAGVAASTAATARQATPAVAPATPVADPASMDALTIPVGDITVAYRVLGQGDPLLLIMGSSGSMDLWDPTLLDELARRYLVITFDNRGIGGTSAAGPYPFEQLADDTAGFIAALGLAQVDVLGWSMGADVGLDLAVRYSDRVRRLVSYAGDCGGPDAIPPSDDVLAALMDPSGTPEEQGERLLGLILPEDWANEHFPYIARVFFRPMSASAPEQIALQGQAIGEWGGICDRLGEIAQPTLIVHGLADVIVPPENALVLVAGIPGSWLVRILDGGHGVQYQHPKQLAQIVDQFLTF